MNKYVLLGVFLAIFVAGLVVIFINNSVSFSYFMRSISRLNPRVLSLLALPLVAVVFVLGVHLHKKSEERMWKKALKHTRDKRAH